jgi:hypothetical protein
VLASFDEGYEKLIGDHQDTKKEMDLVRGSTVQIGQLVQNSLKVNGNGVEWKQVADRADADRHTLCKFLDGQALFTGCFHIYAATYKEMKDSLQPSSMKSGQEDASQADKGRKRDRTLKMSAARTEEAISNLNLRAVTTNNFFAPLRDLPMENGETSSDGNSTKTPETTDRTG